MLLLCCRHAARHRAALAAVDVERAKVDTAPTIAWDAVVPEALRVRERQALVADLVNLSQTLDNFDMQAAEKRATMTRLDSSLAADGKLVGAMRDFG